MSLRVLMGMAGLSCLLLLAAERPDFSGSWRLEGGTGGEALTIKQSDQDLEISGAGGAAPKAECSTAGKECKATLDGEKVTVSYWFNGPVLVEMMTVGKHKDRVVKTRRSLADEGRKMEVEVISIVPPGKTEKLVFVRDEKAEAKR